MGIEAQSCRIVKLPEVGIQISVPRNWTITRPKSVSPSAGLPVDAFPILLCEPKSPNLDSINFRIYRSSGPPTWVTKADGPRTSMSLDFNEWSSTKIGGMPAWKSFFVPSYWTEGGVSSRATRITAYIQTQKSGWIRFDGSATESVYVGHSTIGFAQPISTKSKSSFFSSGLPRHAEEPSLNSVLRSMAPA